MKKFIILLVFGALTACDVLNQLPTMPQQPLTNQEVATGLKQALEIGIQNAVKLTSVQDGFFKNKLITIPIPEEAKKVETTLRNMGMNGVIDKFHLSLNRAAEEASGQAVDIFKSAILQLTFQDVVSIWKGDVHAATDYLKKTSTAQLAATFRPIVRKTIESNGVAKNWKEVADIYNKVPFVQPVNPDLETYVTQRAIDGLFVMVAQEEEKIREDPAARTTDLLKRMFGPNN